jgi:hypothetical protein
MSRQLFSYLCASSFLLLAARAQAQVTFSGGPIGGVMVSTIHYKEAQFLSASSRTGFEAGLLGTASWRHFALQPAVLYSQKGYHLAGTYLDPSSIFSFEGQGDYRLNYLTIPLQVRYAPRITGQGLQVFAGPYVSWLLGGHYESQYRYLTSTRVITREGEVVAGKVGPTSTEQVYSQRWDAGLQAGVGYCYGATVLRVSYSWGLRNLASDVQLNAAATPTATAAYANRAFQVSLAYLFGSKR